MVATCDMRFLLKFDNLVAFLIVLVLIAHGPSWPQHLLGHLSFDLL